MAQLWSFGVSVILRLAARWVAKPAHRLETPPGPRRSTRVVGVWSKEHSIRGLRARRHASPVRRDPRLRDAIPCVGGDRAAPTCPLTSTGSCVGASTGGQRLPRVHSEVDIRRAMSSA